MGAFILFFSNVATYYTFEDHTISSFLEENGVYDFSYFIEILKKAHLWGEMATYGEYTCFAPTNEAVEQYLKENEYTERNWEDTVRAFRDTICSWLDQYGERHYQFEFVRGNTPAAV